MTPDNGRYQQPEPIVPRSVRLTGIGLFLCLVIIVSYGIRPTARRSTQPSSESNTTGLSVLASDKNEPAPPFFAALNKLGRNLDGGCPKNDPVAQRVLTDYGAVFVAKNVMPPSVCVFPGEVEVAKFQTEATFTSAVIGGATIELQPAAMDALVAAVNEAKQSGVRMTPLTGAEAGRRSYADTVRLWKSRFEPALLHWKNSGRLSNEDTDGLRNLSVHDQVVKVLELEKDGIFFSQDFSKSILYSTSAPGASQHISMLAFDIIQYDNPRIRQILANHGWFQTVKGDAPHFTYLGVDESELPALGLSPVYIGGQIFWVPNLTVGN